MVKPGGTHLLADFFGVSASKLICCEEIEAIFNSGASKAGATVLGSAFHHFGEGCGITGVVILSESHMSIHSWPEENFCSVDIFMCGDCDPRRALEVLDNYFVCQYSKIQIIERGK